jgi:hypothetical protein
MIHRLHSLVRARRAVRNQDFAQSGILNMKLLTPCSSDPFDGSGFPEDMIIGLVYHQYLVDRRTGQSISERSAVSPDAFVL